MIRRAMEGPPRSLDSALATLRTRWGDAAVRLGSGRPSIRGSLALAPVADPDGRGADAREARAPASGWSRQSPGEVVSTGFPALDAILGPAGLPREASVTLRGDLSSGKTTLALRCVAEAQAAGAVAAYLDLSRIFDPAEAVGRGVDLRWLLVIRPGDAAEGFALAGALLQGRSVDLLVVDLPGRLHGRMEEGIRRLAAHARRAGARLILLEPVSLSASLQAALAGSTGLSLDLERRGWLRLGQNVVGQRTEVVVARNRYGPPGRSVTLDIHYPGGERAIATHRFASADHAPEQAIDRPVAGGEAAGPALRGRATPRLVAA
jgi:RecA/RadA recombinase